MKNGNGFVSEKDTEQFLRTLIEQSVDGIMVIDSEGVVRFANPAAKKLFQDEIAELEGFYFGTLAVKENVEITIPHDDRQRTIELRATDITWQGETAQLAMLRDITERVQVEEELRKREQLLRETNEMARVGGWALDIDTGEVWWSQVTREIHEVPEDFEPHLDEALDFYPQPNGEELARAIAHTRETGEPYDMELPFVTYQDNHLWVRARGEAEFRGEKMVELRGTFQDITERKQSEEALRNSERQFRQLFENAINGFALSEIRRNGENPPDLIFLDVNQAFEDMLGWKREEMVGQSARKIFHEMEETLLGEKFNEVAETHKPARFEFYSDVLDKYFLIAAYTPQENQIAAIFNDITERKKAEEELRKSERQFRQLFEHDINGFALTEVVTNGDGGVESFIFKEVNQAFEEFLGLNREDVIGKPAVDVFPALLETDLRQIIGEVFLSGESKRFDYFSKTYQKYFNFSTYKPQHDQVAVIFNDITEQKQAEEALRSSEKKFRTLYETMALGALYINEDLEFHTVNPAAEEILGRDAEEISALKYTDPAFHPIKQDGEPLPDEERPSVKALREGKRVEDFVYGLYNPEKEKYVWINVNVVPQFREGEKKPYQAFSTFSDISDRIEAERELRSNEKKFRTLFEAMAQGVVYQNVKGEITSANQTAERILGLSHDQLLGKKSIDEDWQAIRQNGKPLPGDEHPAMVALRTGERVEDFVFGIDNPKRGETVWINVSSVPQFREGEADPYQAFTTFLDITGRIRIQRTLEERVKELRSISNIGTAIQMDPSIPEICQIAVAELVSAMRYPGLARAVIELAGEHYEQNDIPNDVENSLEVPIKLHGEQIGRVRVCYGEEKEFDFPEEKNLLENVSELLASYYDRMQTQQALKESEARFRKAIMAAPNPLAIYAEDGEIITVNAAWTEMSGYKPEEIPKLSVWLEKAYVERATAVKDRVSRLFEAAGPVDEGEQRIRTKDGDERIWYFRSAPLGRLPDGRRAVISMATDITEQERYLDRLLALGEIDQTLNETLDLDEVLHRITTQLSRVMDFTSMAVMLKDQDCLRVIACQGFDSSEEIIGLEIQMDPQYPNYEIIEKRKPIAYENVQEAFPSFAKPLVDVGGVTEIKSWLGAPLIHEGEVIGIFTIDRVEINPFTEEEIEIAMQYANRAAIAIDNAQLYETTLRQLEQLGILRMIDSLITSSLTLDKALAELLGHIQDGLGVDAAAVLLFDEDSKSLNLEAWLGLREEPKIENQIALGQGDTGRVAETKESVIRPEVSYRLDGADFPIHWEAENISSFFAFPMLAKGKLEGVLELFHRTRLDPDEDWISFAETLCEQAAITVDNITLFNDLQKANEDLRKAYDKTIEGWARALELRDKETEGHSGRVVDLTLRVAKRFGFKEEELPNIQRGVLLHDIGKMGIPDNILRKPGPLTEEEWVIMRRHPVFAYNMLKDIDYLAPALTIPHYHHERWDGSGYPEGLTGEEIPLVARIFMVADIWDALTSDRPYRDAWSKEKTIKYLKKQAGKELDPEVVAVTLEIIQEEQLEGIG